MASRQQQGSPPAAHAAPFFPEGTARRWQRPAGRAARGGGQLGRLSARPSAAAVSSPNSAEIRLKIA